MRKISCDSHGQWDTDESVWLKNHMHSTLFPLGLCAQEAITAQKNFTALLTVSRKSGPFPPFFFGQRQTPWIITSFGTVLSSTYRKCLKKTEQQLLPFENVSRTIRRTGHTKNQWRLTEKVVCFLGFVAEITSLRAWDCSSFYVELL